jgi:asparagine synthase (glutamine-hydrolysing)
MDSSCGRYTIIFNGEIYNHLDLRKKYLLDHHFRGHSDTETIVELFRILKEKMLSEMVGMWALIIWDKEAKRIFISRDRFGQKPLYVRRNSGSWTFASEVAPLIHEKEVLYYYSTAVVEYLALGNYGHLGPCTFFKDVRQFPQGSYAWLTSDHASIDSTRYWELPDISDKDKVPFDKKVKKELHDSIVEAVLSQTLSDVPIGITLSGGVDSSIIAGILATYYDKDINIFTAQSANSKYDETKYVNAVINKYGADNFIVHSKNVNDLSIKNDLKKYIRIQEEPFGDPSIIAHGFLMNMAADAGIKVILNGQGADEVFFGYNNMAQAILSQQFKSLQLHKFYVNLSKMSLGTSNFERIMLGSFFPSAEYYLRTRSRINRRDMIRPELLQDVDNNAVSLYKYNSVYNVWCESIYGVHIPHLVHYDDRNGMAYSVEGRMPFLDHRVAECVAKIMPDDFLKNGMRKYLLRESCKQYLPDVVFKRTDKIGFYTPIIDILAKDVNWVIKEMENITLLKPRRVKILSEKLRNNTLNVNDALKIWRYISMVTWVNDYKIKMN